MISGQTNKRQGIIKDQTSRREVHGICFAAAAVLFLIVFQMVFFSVHEDIFASDNYEKDVFVELETSQLLKYSHPDAFEEQNQKQEYAKEHPIQTVLLSYKKLDGPNTEYYNAKLQKINLTLTIRNGLESEWYMIYPGTKYEAGISGQTTFFKWQKDFSHTPANSSYRDEINPIRLGSVATIKYEVEPNILPPRPLYGPFVAYMSFRGYEGNTGRGGYAFVKFIWNYERTNANISASRSKVKKGKGSTVKVTSDAGSVLSVKPLSAKARKKKYVKVTNGSTAKIKFKKTAPKGKYKFEVTSAENEGYLQTTKVISIKVK